MWDRLIEAEIFQEINFNLIYVEQMKCQSDADMSTK